MYQVDHPAYKKLGQIGREITTKVKPRAVVVFSAHWQASRDTIQVNTAEITDLIYECVSLPLYLLPERMLVLMRIVSMASRAIIIKRSIRMWGVRRFRKRCLRRLVRRGLRLRG